MAHDPSRPSRAGRITYRRLRAPQGDGEVLFDPPIVESAAAIDANLRAFDAWDSAIGGRNAQELRQTARKEACEAAVRYTGQYTVVGDPPPGAERIYLVGHQPELFHPGVWLKNFCLDQLGKRDGATAIHVLTDNDVAGNVAVRVPSGGLEDPQLVEVELDRPTAAVAWEERTLLDARKFREVGDAICDHISPLFGEPLAEPLWRFVGDDDVEGANLGQTLARLRHQLELSWGVKTLEVPLSMVCQSNTFRWFVASIITRLPQVHASCNQALAEYRRLHHLRSPSHPMPNLKRDGQRFEAPFWVWTREQPQRRTLFVEQSGDRWRLSDGASWKFSTPVADEDNLADLTQALTQLEDAGVKIRPKALTTTMYLRLFLADCFIHGIGGAKYDQVTDCVIEDLFGLRPPAFLTATGTRLLPIAWPDATGPSTAELDRSLREWEFHPEKLLPADLSEEQKSRALEFVREKQNLTSQAASLDARQRHTELTRVNGQLQQLAPKRREELVRLRGEAQSRERARELLTARDFSICLYPESTLRPWLLGAASATT